MSIKNGLSRRDILKGSILTAGAGAVAMLSAGVTNAEAAPKAKPAEEYDLVIVGAGCAGLVCAIRAAELGLKPVLLEKMPRPAGNTVFAGGHLLALHSKTQKAQGINEDDSAELFYEDMMAVSQQRGDKVITKFFVENSSETIDWLSDSVGIKWKKIVREVYPARGRSHVVDGPSKPGGAQLSKQLVECAQSKNVPMLFNTKVIELLTNDMLAVTGVKAVTKEGAKDFMGKYGVVIATGGFHANNEMVTSLMGGWAANMPIRGSRIIAGENFILTRPLFPKFVNVDQFHAGPIHGPTGANPSIMVNYGILVTDDGKRYIDEVNTYVRVAKETAKLTKDNWAFIILDSEPRGISTVEERFERYKRAKAPIYEGNTIAELAKNAKIDPVQLEKTVKEYNDAVKKGAAGKLTPPNTLENPRAILKAPFYAVPYQGGMTATFGGPQVNVKAQVINAENKPVEGLYAIGNSVGGIFYDDYIVGAQLTSAAIFGRVAAQEIAKRKQA